MLSIHKYFMFFILEYVGEVFDSYIENREDINMIIINPTEMIQKYHSGKFNNKKNKKLNGYIIQKIFQFLKSEGMMKEVFFIQVPQTDDFIILMVGFHWAKWKELRLKWKYEDIDHEDVLLKKFYDLINDDEYKSVTLIKDNNGDTKEIIAEKYIKSEDVKFVDLKKNYPNATIEAVVFEGKIQYYKIKEKLQ